MKKLLLIAFVATAFITSCAKDVKAPTKTANTSNAKANTTSATGPQATGSQPEHTCGSGSGHTSTGH